MTPGRWCVRPSNARAPAPAKTICQLVGNEGSFKTLYLLSPIALTGVEHSGEKFGYTPPPSLDPQGRGARERAARFSWRGRMWQLFL